MKNLTNTLFVAAQLLLPALAFANPTEIPSPVDKVFVPQGFDDNDNAEIVLHGEFPNTCYQVGRTVSKVDEKNHEISVWAISLRYPGENCKEVKVPFIQSVKIGVLSRGDYKVVVKGADSIVSALAIAPRHVEAPEDFLYAPVASAALANTPDGARQTLTLNGYYPHMFVGCMVIDEIRTSLTPDNVLVVQPIAKIVEDNTDTCQKQASDKSFQLSKDLDTMLHGEGLIHVRVLNGDAINQFVPAR